MDLLQEWRFHGFDILLQLMLFQEFGIMLDLLQNFLLTFL
jgi:hypothetical protein